MAPTHHKTYFMKDGVSFLVEDTLFRVPRYMLENSSPVFATMLSDINADAGPTPLPKVTSADFERLLTFLYPLTPQVGTVQQWDEHQWIAILRLATMWEMTEIRTMAMRLLSQIQSPLTKITLGREYGHLPWVKEGFIMLCLRPDPLTVDEAVQLTKADVITCAAAREKIRSCIVFPKADMGSEPIVQSNEYRRLLNCPKVRQIFNDVFGFEPEVQDETDAGATGSDKITWWRSQGITTPRIFCLTGKHGKDSQRNGPDQDVKRLPQDSTSAAVTVAENLLGDPCTRELKKYLTLLCLSAIALAVGLLILIPKAHPHGGGNSQPLDRD